MATITFPRYGTDASDPLTGINAILKGELGRIDGFAFIETSPNVNIETGGKVEKRTGYDEMAEKFKAIDKEIKEKWGK